MQSIDTLAFTAATKPDPSWWDQVVAFWDARDDHLVTMGIILVVALVLHIVQAVLLRTWANRMKFRGFRWTSGVATSLSAPLGWAIWVVALTLALQHFIDPSFTAFDSGPATIQAAADSTGTLGGANPESVTPPANSTGGSSSDAPGGMGDVPQHNTLHAIILFLGGLRVVMLFLLGGWFLSRTIRYFERVLSEIAIENENLDLTIVRALSNFLVIGVWLLIVLIALQTYGVNMTAIITIGGAGGFALTFAFQDVFKNLFGGVMILFSRPFKLGDGIQVGSVSGSVEKIGLYQTIVQGWDAVPFILPNSMFLTNPIMNLGKRAQRRFQFDVGLRYEDFARVEPIVKDVNEYLQGHPQIDSDKMIRVYFSLYGDSSLNISVTCFAVPELGGTEYSVSELGGTEWYELEQDVLLRVGQIVTGHGADFAFPTTTIDYPSASGPA